MPVDDFLAPISILVMNSAILSSLPIERSIYVANILSGILYGILVYMVFQSYHLLKNLKRETPRRRKFYIFYGFIQLFLVTVEFSLTALAGQLMWIDHRDSPRGPFAYYLSISSGWFGVGVIACAVVSIGMADALLLHRCYIIWNGNLRVILLPLLLYISELAMGIAVPIEVALSHTTFLSKPSTNFSIPWVSLECSLTAILTALIVGRILYVAHKTKLNTNYTGIVSLLVEPAFLLSLSGTAFAVCVGQNFLRTVPLANIWFMLVAIAPQSIILRVAMGRAWTENIASEVTRNIEFAHRNSTSRRFQENDNPAMIHVKSEDSSNGTV